MTDQPSIEGERNSPAVSMRLNSEAISDTANTAIHTLAARISTRRAGREPLRNHLMVLAAVIADLLKGAAFDPVRPCYRPMRAANFTGMAVGYHPFNTVLDDLAAAKLVDVNCGWWDPKTLKGVVTRIYPTEMLLNELASFGITPANWGTHFVQRSGIPLVPRPIQRRAAATRNRSFQKYQGRRMDVDTNDPNVAVLAAEVNAVNEFLAKQTYEGMVFDGLFRGFNMGDHPKFDWNMGGRLYALGGGYQSIKKGERKAVRINGEATAEVDISGSHLTILHALMGVDLPNPLDAYGVPGLDRDPVKLFATASIGYGKIPTRWSSETVKLYAKSFANKRRRGYTGSLRVDYPFKLIRDRVLDFIPLLRDIEECPFNWADLQYIESKALINAMNKLISNEIPCLPIHDALIIPGSYKREAFQALSKSFYDLLKVKPIIKVI